MEILRIFSLLILLIGLTFLVAELITEEVEIFAPIAIFTIIVGLIFFFLSDPKTWFGIAAAFYPYFVLIIIIIGLIPILFSLIILIKIRKVKKKPPEQFDFIGKEVSVVKEIAPNQKGYVLARGEKWNAVSSDLLQKGEKAIIEKADLDELTLTVKKLRAEPQQAPKKEIKKKECPYCLKKIDINVQICPHCGMEFS
ncbi:MAG: NfeD family protein [Promethearchaeia archaeon]